MKSKTDYWLHQAFLKLASQRNKCWMKEIKMKLSQICPKVLVFRMLPDFKVDYKMNKKLMKNRMKQKKSLDWNLILFCKVKNIFNQTSLSECAVQFIQKQV